MSEPSLLQRQDIRQHVRHLRRALTPEQQHTAAEQLAEHAINFAPVSDAQNVALFLSVDGEINTRPLIAKLWQQNKRVYLPVLHPFSAGHLLFLRYTPETPLSPNKLRIPEPPLDIRHMVTLDEMDVMMVPLVAFDRSGQRLGMGAALRPHVTKLETARFFTGWHRARLPVGRFAACGGLDIPLPAVLTPSTLWLWEE